MLKMIFAVRHLSAAESKVDDCIKTDISHQEEKDKPGFRHLYGRGERVSQ